MIVNKDRMHTYFVCKLLKLQKLIKNALKQKSCKFRNMSMGEMGKFKILQNFGLMYLQQLKKMFHPVAKALENKIVSFVRNQLFIDYKKDENVTTGNDLNSSSTDSILNSALKRKGHYPSARTIRTVIRMNKNMLRIMKRKMKKFFYIKLKKYENKETIPINVENKKKISSMEAEDKIKYYNVLKFIEFALKSKKLIYRAFDDSFPIGGIKHNSISIRSIIKKLCAKKKIRSKVRRHKISQKESRYFELETNKASESFKKVENLLKRKGLSPVPKILIYTIYTYRKLLKNIEKRKMERKTVAKTNTKEIKRFKKKYSSSVKRTRKFERNNPQNIIYAKRTYRKKASRLIRRCLNQKKKYYSDKKIKQNDRKLRLYIDKILKSRGYNPFHRNMVNNLISKVLPLIKFIGKDRLNVKSLSVFIKMILMHKFFKFGSLSQQHSDPEMYSMEYIEASDNINIDDLDEIIHHLQTYIFERHPRLFMKGNKKESEVRNEIHSAYKICDPDLHRFYKYVLPIMKIPSTARWKLRKLILQHGATLKKCGQLHYKRNAKKHKENLYEVCTESEGTDSVEELFKSLQDAENQEEAKTKRPLYRPETEQLPKQPPESIEKNAPQNEVYRILEVTHKDTEKNVKGPVTPCIPDFHGAKNTKDEVKLIIRKEAKPFMINVNKVYQFKNCLHRGEYGSVNSYYSQILKRDVAIKSISKMKVPIEIFKFFLPRSQKLIWQLKHPNIVKYYEAFENGAKLYVVMELAENGSLSNYIQNRGRLDQVVYHKFLAQIIDAVYYCFQMNIFHRKISCDNILVTKANNIKLCDFSYARGIDKECLFETYCGVLAFTAPEILESRPYNPHLSEVWSIGVVTYAMVYGVLPFDSSIYTNLLKQVRTKLEFKRYPDTPFAVINLMHNMIAPLNRRWDIIMVMNDPWLFKQNIFRDNEEIKEMENVKIWKEIKEQISSSKGILEGTILKHIAEFATESEFRKIQKRSTKKKEYIPEKMKWLFQFY